MNFNSIGASYSFISQSITINLPEKILLRLVKKKDYTDIEDSLLYGKFVHEMTHYIQNITTSYGLWKTLMLRSAGFSFHLGIILYENDGNSFDLPINYSMHNLISLNHKGLEHFAKGKTRHIAVNMMEYQHKHPVHNNFAGCYKPKKSTTPFVSYCGTTYGITTGILLEFQAYIQQINALDTLKTIPKKHADNFFNEITKSMSIKLILGLIGLAFNKKEKNIFLEITAYEIITLSLNPRFTNNPFTIFNKFEEKKTNLLSWEEMHPGWRFYKIFNLIKDKKMLLPNSIYEVEILIENICESLGWLNSQESVMEFYSNIQKDPMMQDISSLKNIIKESFLVNTLSIYRDSTYSNNTLLQKRKKIMGTPLPYYNTEDTHKNIHAVFEISTQMFFDKEFFCPLCKQKKHTKYCTVPAYADILKKQGLKNEDNN